MPNNDLISRNDVLEIIMQYCADDDGSCAKPNADLREMLDEVENITAVDAKPIRHGKYGWVGMDMLAGTRSFYYGTCSECKERINFAYEHKNYCPNCGAKMDKEE